MEFRESFERRGSAMSGQEEPVEVMTAEEIRGRINDALGLIGAENREMEHARLRIEESISSLTTLLRSIVAPHEKIRDELTGQVVEDFLKLVKMKQLTGQTLSLPNGQVSVRTGGEALIVDDMKKLMARLRRLRLLKRTTRVKRELDKEKTKDLPASDLKLLAPYAHVGNTTRVTVKPNTMLKGLGRDLNPQQRIVTDAAAKAAADAAAKAATDATADTKSS